MKLRLPAVVALSLTGLLVALLIVPAQSQAAASPCSNAPASASAWQSLFSSIPRAGDGYMSSRLGNGRIAWMLGDTARLDKRDFIHNAMLITCGNMIHQVGTIETIPNQADGSYYWSGPSVVDSGKLYVLAPHVQHAVDWPYFASIGTDIAVFNIPLTGDPAFRGFASTPSSHRANGVQWGAGAIKNGSYVYLYGQHQPADAWGMSVQVARIPTGKLATLSAWRYWNGTSWSAKEASAKDIIDAQVDGTDTAFSVNTISGSYAITTKRSGAFSSDVGRFSSTTPTGPFTWTSLAQVPTTADLRTYLPAAHPETGITNLISVNQQPQGKAWPDDIWANPDNYRPLWLQP
jgi:hypothetical protein